MKEELLERIFLAFKDVSTEMACNSDFFELPTYWHIDGIPFLIKENKKSISVEIHKSFPKKILIYEGTSKDDIVKLIRQLLR
jgi:hypothetical protein